MKKVLLGVLCVFGLIGIVAGWNQVVRAQQRGNVRVPAATLKKPALKEKPIIDFSHQLRFGSCRCGFDLRVTMSCNQELSTGGTLRNNWPNGTDAEHFQDLVRSSQSGSGSITCGYVGPANAVRVRDGFFPLVCNECENFCSGQIEPDEERMVRAELEECVNYFSQHCNVPVEYWPFGNDQVNRTDYVESSGRWSDCQKSRTREEINEFMRMPER